MAYSKNVLPLDAAYYSLQNATINNGILSLYPGGKAYINIDKTILQAIPSSVLLNFFTSQEIDPLSSDVSIFLDILMEDGTSQNIVVYPSSQFNDGVSLEIALDDGEYNTFQFRIQSQIACDFLLWELCPELQADITTIIEGVEQSLPHLLYDYNTWPLQVEQDETSIGMIACELLGNTDVNGHFSLDFYSSEYCNVYIRFKDNEITELYTPLLFTVNPGHNTIGIPHAYLKRLAGVHNFVVTCQCTNGILDIYPRGLLFTIDAGYLAERLIDAGLDIMDLSIRQLNIVSGPDEIWCIGLDAGEILVRSRPYKTQANTAWTPRYALGQGLDAAIEFDGDWERVVGETNYTLKTQERPYVFIVDLDGNLVCYTFTYDGQNSIILDTDVKSVSAIRGYKSSLYIEQDQGLVVAYIKNDGKAYYRQYKYIAIRDAFIWDEICLLDEHVLHLVVNRLNDYRIGFTLEQADRNRLVVSDRTYVAQSVKPEYLYPTVTTERILFNFDTTLTSTIGVCENINSSEGIDTFEIVYMAPIRDYFGPGDYFTGLELMQEQIVVTCDRIDEITIKRVLIQDNKLIVTVSKPLQGAVTINIPDYNYLYITHEPEARLGKFISGQTLTVNIMSEYMLCGFETKNVKLGVTGKIIQRDIVTNKVFAPEDVGIILLANPTEFSSKEIVDVPALDNDVTGVSLSITGTFVVTPTGTSPI